MRRVLLPLLFVVLCLGLPGLCRGGEAAVVDAPTASASPYAYVEAKSVPIPDVPPPGWTEAQLADLRKMEIQLRHTDTMLGGNVFPHYFTLFVSDGGKPGNRSPLCVRRIFIMTWAGDVVLPKKSSLNAGECVGYESFIYTEDLLMASDIFIKRARMDVAPNRDAPASSELRGLDAVPMLRSAPLPPVILTAGKRPLPKTIPDHLVGILKGERSWPEKIRIHLKDSFTDPDHPEHQCVSLALTYLPTHGWSFSRMMIRTNFGDRANSDDDSKQTIMPVCAPGGISRLDIQQGTVWKGNKPVNAAPLLIDGFQRLGFFTSEGPLPPTAAGPYPFRPREEDRDFKPYVRPNK